MSTTSRSILRYSISFKQKIVCEIEEDGLSISEAQRRYAIKGSQTIQQWLRKFGKHHLLNKIVRVEMKDEKDRIKELEAQLQKAKLALADATMKNDTLEILIDLVNQHYQTDVKKNLGQPLSGKAIGKKDIR